jgi:hypothetical protein
MIARRDNWPDLLAAYIERKRSEPFAWGGNDCCMFGADWIREATDVDPAAVLRGTYSTALGGMRLINEHGGMVGIMQRFIQPFGFQEISAGSASRGDIIVRDCGLGDAAGIVIGSNATFVGKGGLIFANISDGVPSRFWKI